MYLFFKKKKSLYFIYFYLDLRLVQFICISWKICPLFIQLKKTKKQTNHQLCISLMWCFDDVPSTWKSFTSGMVPCSVCSHFWFKILFFIIKTLMCTFLTCFWTSLHAGSPRSLSSLLFFFALSILPVVCFCFSTHLHQEAFTPQFVFFLWNILYFIKYNFFFHKPGGAEMRCAVWRVPCILLLPAWAELPQLGRAETPCSSLACPSLQSQPPHHHPKLLLSDPMTWISQISLNLLPTADAPLLSL